MTDHKNTLQIELNKSLNAHIGLLSDALKQERIQKYCTIILFSLTLLSTQWLGPIGGALAIPVLVCYFVQKRDTNKSFSSIYSLCLISVAEHSPLKDSKIPSDLLSELHPIIGGVAGVTFAELKIFAQIHKNNTETLARASRVLMRYRLV